MRWGNGYHRERRAHPRGMHHEEAAGLMVVIGAVVFFCGFLAFLWLLLAFSPLPVAS